MVLISVGGGTSGVGGSIAIASGRSTVHTGGAVSLSSGEGTATYSNGDIYDGMFLSGKRQGTGTMRYASGEKESGTWDNGALTPAE